MIRFWIWVFLLLFLSLAMGDVIAHGEECGALGCTATRWVLHVDGEPIDVGSDLTQEECVDLAAQIDPGPPFTEIIKCVEEAIARTES